MSVVRMNITLPEKLARQLDKLVEPKKKSQFIAETLQRRIARIGVEKLQEILEEGYKKTRKKETQSLQRGLNPLIWRDGMNIKRGEIYLAALDPVLGREISKTRPVFITSNNKNNLFSGTVTILPIFPLRILIKFYPFEVFLPKQSGKFPKNSKVKADQIRS